VNSIVPYNGARRPARDRDKAFSPRCWFGAAANQIND
jgi:hypothetical protein